MLLKKKTLTMWHGIQTGRQAGRHANRPQTCPAALTDGCSCEESSSEEGGSEEPTAGVSEARTTENVPQRKHALRCQRSVAQ